MYILLDTNITAGYYLKKSLTSTKAFDRIENIFNSVRSKGSNHFFYIPNICIAEVFNVFRKYSFGKWNVHVIKKGKTIDTRIYNKLVKQFEEDIHNSKFLYQYELTRYHILAVHFIAPIDHYYRIDRGKKNIRPMSTFDHLIISMGIHLAYIHGKDNVVLLTSDDRISNIVKKCKSNISRRTIKRLKLNIAEEVTGKSFSADLFPMCLNLKSSKISELQNVFGGWPLEIGNRRIKVYRYLGL